MNVPDFVPFVVGVIVVAVIAAHAALLRFGPRFAGFLVPSAAIAFLIAMPFTPLFTTSVDFAALAFMIAGLLIWGGKERPELAFWAWQPIRTRVRRR